MKNNSRKKLIIDACVTIAEVLKIIFKKKFTILPATSSPDRLKKSKVYKPDLEIPDIILPQTEGHTVCRKTKEAPSLISSRVLLFTTKDGKEPHEKGEIVHADGFVSKEKRDRQYFKSNRRKNEPK